MKDVYVYNKKSNNIKEATQHKMLTIVNDIVDDIPVFSYTQKLSKEMINELCLKSIKIEKYYEKPTDIEFAVYKNKIYFLQARPITT